MRHTLLTTILALITLLSFAQTQSYEVEAEKCKAVFQKNLASRRDSLSKLFSEAGNCLVGLQFPDFNLISIDGEQYKLSELKGKVIMLNFWFIGCAPCVEEMPLLNQLTEEYKGQDFLLLSFSTDNKEAIFNFRKRHEIKYVIFENSRDLIHDSFHLSYGYPTNIFLDKEGKIVKVKLGGDPKKMKAIFKEIIDNGLMSKK